MPGTYLDSLSSEASLIFFCRYKREAYRGSEFAPRILAENGLRVVMKVSLVLLHYH